MGRRESLGAIALAFLAVFLLALPNSELQSHATSQTPASSFSSTATDLQGHPESGAGTNRTVLIEAFVPQWSQYSKYSSRALALLQRNTSLNVIALAELHGCNVSPCPDSYSDTGRTSVTRIGYYDVLGFPTVVFDGTQRVIGAVSFNPQTLEGVYQRAVANASAYPGNVSISQSVVFSGAHNLSLSVQFTPMVSGNFFAISYLVEFIGKNTTTPTGIDYVGSVVRETVLNQSITFSAGQPRFLSVTAPLNSSWDRQNLSEITFVQEVSSKIVENTNLVRVPTPTFAVNFTEQGLPAGTPWGVTLDGDHQTSQNSTIAFETKNGTYPYSIDYQNGFSSLNSGTISVNGSSVSTTVVFASIYHSLTFQETGLPNGTGWGVIIGARIESSITQNLTFLLVDGTYSYVCLSVVGFVTPPAGVVVLNGSSVLISLGYRPQLYPIVFIEFGLPPGSNWSVTLTNLTLGFNVTRATNTNSLIVFLPNGTYQVSFALPANFTSNPSSTSITVAGGRTQGVTTYVTSGPHRGASGQSGGPGISFEELGWIIAVISALAAGIAVGAFAQVRRQNPPSRR